jgi:hypothetical protein
VKGSFCWTFWWYVQPWSSILNPCRDIVWRADLCARGNQHSAPLQRPLCPPGANVQRCLVSVQVGSCQGCLLGFAVRVGCIKQCKSCACYAIPIIFVCVMRFGIHTGDNVTGCVCVECVSHITHDRIAMCHVCRVSCVCRSIVVRIVSVSSPCIFAVCVCLGACVSLICL